MWADFPNFLRQLSDQVAITGSGHWGATTNPGRYYLDTLTGPGAGWALVVMAAGYTAYALATRDARRWIVVSFPVFYIWFMTGRPSQFPRWVYPMLPYVAMTGSAALVAVARVLHERIASRPQPFARSADLAVAGLMLVVLLQPARGGGISFSRRVTPTTQALTENWLRTNAQEGSVVLLGRGWLDVRDARFSARRVPNLKATLDGGLEQLAGCNWVVVPETVFGHPSLKQLSLAQRFEAGYGFGGNLGYDYEVYAVPDLPAHGNCGGKDAEVRR